MNTRRNIGRKHGFTMVELLVVMGIMATIAVLIMPAIGTARQAAARSQARQQMNDLVTSMLAYRETYGRFPLQSHTSSDHVYTDMDYIRLIAILRAQDPGDGIIADFNTLMDTHNPKRIAFLTVDDSRVEEGVLVDPWHRRFSGDPLTPLINVPYQVAADWMRNNQVNTGTTSHSTVRGRAVVAWSYGQQGRPTDDAVTAARLHIRSWED